MNKNISLSRRIFIIFNYLFLCSLMVICILPFLHLIAVSLSSSINAAAGIIGFIPKGFTLKSYEFLATKPEFLRALLVSIIRVILGTSLNMFMVVITAYPLSKSKESLVGRTIYIWFFVFTMYFGGGMIPSYMVVKMTGLINHIWALIIPGALSVWNMVLLLNFFRQIPKELEEAAIIDGASQWSVLWRIYLPVSKPALATILLFSIVGHWNSWFDGVLYINSPKLYPLQTYLSTIVLDINKQSMSTLSPEGLERLKNISEQSVRCAQIFLGALPILLVYPCLQRYFIKGLVIGSVKG